jgi:hypothetical protein
METAALPLTTLSIEPATGTQSTTPDQPSGEFTKVLHAQTSPADDGKGRIPKGQDEDSLPTMGGQTSLILVALLPAALPIGTNLLEGKNVNLGPGEVRNPNASGEPASVFNSPQGFKSNPAMPYLQEILINDSPSAPMDEPLNFKFAGGEGLTPGNSPTKRIFPLQGQPSSLFGGKMQDSDWESRFFYHPGTGENIPVDSNLSPRGEVANVNAEFLMKGKDPIENDTKSADISKSLSQKDEEMSGIFAKPVDHPLSANSSGEIGRERALGSGQTKKLEIYEQIGQKLIWSLNNREEQFRLTLDPPQLGSIYMEIQREKEHIKATLWAENPNTKNILEANQLSIQKIIESEGFSLESFSVFIEQDLGSFQESRGGRMNPEPTASPSTAEINQETITTATSAFLSFQRNTGLMRAIDLIV